ncbi:hypothetical protein IMG5_156660 [Ichthyophthirius multifiliis]|uniref:Uncharacterized protein n=1 Tax=Ichthyophthirius multifiliis TaxID=5932 RepID=G0QZG8_ICHMU|nr:hypothetical protein IMG5_156660 [Ichthyophthirius multifiliis]EGR29386.1 hypothetical protein IMG5_156660 [Ichthyophthirius multifiliis]|eukprot:XP_004030622.1 hypothetical protein IMG5_156660 [Ichthyophthirius multifiliis]
MNTTQLVPTYDDVRTGKTWVGGPTYEIQKQHIPGYQGHVKALEAESQHGKTFAKITAECINNRYKSGFIIDQEEQFKTNYKLEFQKPNLRNNPAFSQYSNINEKQKIDEIERLELIKTQLLAQPRSIDDVPPIDRVHVIGYQGFKPVYRYPIKQIKPQSVEEINQQAQTILALTKGDLNPPKEVPVVGYSGFQKSIKSENMFGKTFKELSNLSNKQY